MVKEGVSVLTGRISAFWRACGERGGWDLPLKPTALSRASCCPHRPEPALARRLSPQTTPTPLVNRKKEAVKAIVDSPASPTICYFNANLMK